MLSIRFRLKRFANAFGRILPASLSPISLHISGASSTSNGGDFSHSLSFSQFLFLSLTVSRSPLSNLYFEEIPPVETETETDERTQLSRKETTASSGNGIILETTRYSTAQKCGEKKKVFFFCSNDITLFKRNIGNDVFF